MRPQPHEIAQALARHYGKEVTVSERGEGFNGKGFELQVGDRRFFLKIVNDGGFGNELPHRRLARLVEGSHPYAHAVPVHAVFAGGDEAEIIGSIGEIQEAFALHELLPDGSQNFLEVLRDPQTKLLQIREMGLQMADVAADIHEQKYEGENAKALYDYSTSAVVHDGELMPGVWDFLRANRPNLVQPKHYAKLMSNMLLAREAIGTHPERLSRVHGDFWAANIFEDPQKNILVTDSRIVWGEPALDVAWMIGEIMMQGLIRNGRFDGDYSRLADDMVKHYQKRTGDKYVRKYMGLPYAFQAFAEATFTPGLTDDQRRQLVGAANGGVLAAQSGIAFNPNSIAQYSQSGRKDLGL